MSQNNSEMPTNPGTPEAKGANKLRVMVPIGGQLTSGELRDFVTVFTTLGEDIKILEKRVEDSEAHNKKQDEKIAELQNAMGRVESLCAGLSNDTQTFINEVRRTIRQVK